MLKATASIYKLYIADGDYILFNPSDDEYDWSGAKGVNVDAGVWADMGRPNTITVTIEPGNKLN